LAIAGHQALFPNPSPALATIDSAVSDLEKAQAAVLARVKGATEQRAAKRAALVQLVEALRNYVQGVADLANPEDAAATIHAAGFSVRKVPPHRARVFSVIQGVMTGSVKVVAPSGGKRASYDWQWSTDGGKTWTLAPSTLQSKTTLQGFAAGSTVSFRYRVTTKAGEGEWSQAIAFLVK